MAKAKIPTKEKEKREPKKKTTVKKSTVKKIAPKQSTKLTFKEYNEKRIALVNQIDSINDQIDKLELELLASNALQAGQIVTVRDMPGAFIVVQVQRKFNANLVAVSQISNVEVFEGAIDNINRNAVNIEVLLREITGIVE
jgi:hypothetical protein